MNEEFTERIHKLNKGDLIQLLELIPLFQLDPEYGEMIAPEDNGDGNKVPAYFVPSELVSRFLTIVHDIPIILDFDWIKWKEGEEILKNPNSDFRRYDMVTLCKLITSIVKYDRFSEGYLLSKFNNGTILNILKAIEIKYS